jgi:hypothetical protein
MYKLITIFVLIFLQITGVMGFQHVLNHDTNDDPNICKKGVCVKKCCPENHILKRKICTKSDKHKFQLNIFDGTRMVNESVSFNVIHGRNCTDGGVNLRLAPMNFESDIHYLQRNGSLYRPFSNIEIINFDKFCFETFQLRNRTEFAALVCTLDVIPEPEGVCSYGKFLIILHRLFQL